MGLAIEQQATDRIEQAYPCFHSAEVDAFLKSQSSNEAKHERTHDGLAFEFEQAFLSGETATKISTPGFIAKRSSIADTVSSDLADVPGNPLHEVIRILGDLIKGTAPKYELQLRASALLSNMTHAHAEALVERMVSLS